MNPFLSIPGSSLETLIEPLGWALVHSFWQIFAVAAIAAVIVRLMRQGSAQARYAVLLAALAAAVIWPVITFALLPVGAPLSAPVEATSLDEGAKETVPPNYSNPISVMEPISPKANEGEPIILASPQSEPQDLLAASTSQPNVPLTTSWAEKIQVALKPWLGWLVGFWVLGMVLCSFRPLLGWFTLNRLRRVGVSQVPAEILDLLHRVSGRLGLRRVVSIKQSVLATVPVVIGYLRPTILLPLSVLGHMPVAQLEAIIAHELAHVRRHDFLWNLIQTLIETLFFYHPAIWWLSHRIRIEREHCCDDLVVGMLGNRVAYGRALIAVEQLRGQSSILALGATDGSLLSRIRRIVGSPTAGAVASSWSLPGLIFLSACVFLLANLIPWKGVAEANAAQTQAEEPPASSPMGSPEEIETLVGDESKGPTALQVIGRIVDADTGKPIERAAFQGGRQLPDQPGKVEWGYSFSYGDRLPNGEFAQTLNWANRDRRRVLAAGYEPASILDELPDPLPNPPVVERTIRLKKGRLVQGTLRNHLGQGVANSQVFFIPEGHRANIINGVPGLDSPGSHAGSIDHSVTQVKTDAEGRFEIPAGGNGILAASSEQVDLWPFATPAEGQSADLTLPKPGQLKIDLAHWYLDDMAKKAGEKNDSAPEDPNRIFLHVYRMDGSDNLWKKCAYGGNMLVFAEDAKAPVARNVRIGPIDRSQKPALIEGKWQNRSLSTQMLVNLPPGHYQIHRYREGERSPQATMIEIKSGEIASLDWTRAEGAAVIGSVALPANSQFVRQEGEAPRKLDWTIPHNGYVLIYSRQGASKNETLEVARIQKDGSFQIPTHLPPGTYQASAWAWLPESDQSMRFSGFRLMPGLVAEKEFTVPKPPAEGALPLRLQLAMESKSSQIVTANQTSSPSAEGGAPAEPAGAQMTEDEVARKVLATLRKPYHPDPKRGSWQGGAFDAEVLMNLRQLQPHDGVVKTLMKVVEGKEPSNLQQRRLALIHLAGAAPGQLIPFLIQDLASKEAKTVNAADRMIMMHEMDTLGRIGEEARAAIPVLIKKLSDREWDFSEVAIGALVKIGPQSPEVVTALSGRFDNHRAVYEAARFGELAKPLGPIFVELLDSRNQEIRTFAAYGLVKSGFNPSLGLDFLIKQVDQGTAAQRDLALTALGALGSEAKTVAEALRTWGKDQNDTFGREISRTIDRIEKNDRILTHAEEAVKTAAARKAAREAIEKLQAAQARLSAPRPKELDFLASYPKLKDLSLAMTEKEFLEIARKEKLKLHIDLGKEGSKYHLPTGDGLTLIVMFRKGAETCTGIQRIRGDEGKEPSKTESLTSGASNQLDELRFTGQLRDVPLKEALAWVANAASLELQIDEAALKAIGLHLDVPMIVKFDKQTPKEIFKKLFAWNISYQIVNEIRGGKLIVTTYEKDLRLIQNQLPNWLKGHKDQPAVILDEDNQITYLSVRGAILNDDFFTRLSTLPKLKNLHIAQTKRLSPASLARLAGLPQLEGLHVDDLKNEGKSLGDEIIKILEGLKSLRELSMTSCGVTDSGIRRLENLGSLRKLTLRNENLLTDEALASIGRMTQLHSLNLTSPNSIKKRSQREEVRPSIFTEVGLRKLAGLKNLEELNLVGQPVGPEAFNFPKLKSLELGHHTFNSACAEKIAQSHDLESFTLYHSPISDEAAKYVGELSKLTKLDLTGCDISDNGISYLKGLKKLANISLLESNFTDMGLKEIAQFPALNILVITNAVITDEGIGYLESAKIMQDISLGSGKLSDLSLKSLAQIKTLNKIVLFDMGGGFSPFSSPRKGFTMAGLQQLKALPNLRSLWLTSIHLKEGYWGLKEFTQLQDLGISSSNFSKEEYDVIKESLPNTRIHGRLPNGQYFP